MEEMPPGYRFYPTEEELVSFYLHSKLKLQESDDPLNRRMDRIIPVVQIYDFNPWDLPQISGDLCHGDPEQWFFFIPRQEREARGGRPNRLTNSGYWKATGSPGYVYSSDNRHIGVKRAMVFYQGRAPNGRKSQWKMNEYKAIDGDATKAQPVRQDFSLCRIYIKSKCFRSFDRRPSKCFRSFDRRQSKLTIGRETEAQHETDCAHVDEEPVKVTDIRSPESLSSCEHQHRNQDDQHCPGDTSSNWGISVDDDLPLWDWEHMNLF